MEMRDVLGYFSYKYYGDNFKILTAIERKEKVSDEQIQAFHKRIKYDFFTIVDDNYPEMLKHVNNPPIVMFYQGDMSLIHEDNEIIAKETIDGVRMIHAYETNITNRGIEMKSVMACECHEDMDMLVDKMHQAQETLKNILSIVPVKEAKEKSFER